MPNTSALDPSFFIERVKEAVSVPVKPSGGAGKLSDFVEIFKKGKDDAALAA